MNKISSVCGAREVGSATGLIAAKVMRPGMLPPLRQIQDMETRVWVSPLAFLLIRRSRGQERRLLRDILRKREDLDRIHFAGGLD